MYGSRVLITVCEFAEVSWVMICGQCRINFGILLPFNTSSMIFEMPVLDN